MRQLFILSTFDNIHYTSGSGAKIKVVAEQELQSTECLERKDRILRELIQLICSFREVQRAAELHKRQRPQ